MRGLRSSGLILMTLVRCQAQVHSNMSDCLALTPSPSALSVALGGGSNSFCANYFHSVPPGGICIRCWSGKGRGLVIQWWDSGHYVLSFIPSTNPYWVPSTSGPVLRNQWCTNTVHPLCWELTSNGECIHVENIQTGDFFLPHWPNNLVSFSCCGFQVGRFLCSHPRMLIEGGSERTVGFSSDFIRKRRSSEDIK